MIGSGAWASAAIKIIGENTGRDDVAHRFADEVKMWVKSDDPEVGRHSTSGRIIWLKTPLESSP